MEIDKGIEDRKVVVEWGVTNGETTFTHEIVSHAPGKPFTEENAKYWREKMPEYHVICRTVTTVTSEWSEVS